MNPTMGTHSHQRATKTGPKHSHAMIKNEAPNPSRMLPMRALSRSNCARRVWRSTRRCEYCSVGDTKIVWHISRSFGLDARIVASAPSRSRPENRLTKRTFKPNETVDFVIVGSGAAGGVIARELSQAGFNVIVLEQGPRLGPRDFEHDELKYGYLSGITCDPKVSPQTFRDDVGQ